MSYIFDNSNLNESYSGVTSHLTASFARRVYEQVYIQFCRFMGVSVRVIEDNHSMFAQMVIQIGGRMYYDLKNWHQMISFFPGYTLNGAFLEDMLGIPEEMRGQILVKKSKLQNFVNLVYVCWLLVRMIGIFLTMRLWIILFDRRFLSRYHAIEQEICNLDSWDSLLKLYTKAELDFTKDFKIPIANDFAVMISVGLLKKRCEQWFDDGGQIANQFISGHAGIKSAEPGRYLFRLVKKISQDSSLVQLFKSKNLEHIYSTLNKSHPDIFKDVDYYIQHYGDRVPGELKLESITYTNQPLELIRIIKGQIQSFKQEVTQSVDPDSDQRFLVQISKLSWFQRIEFAWLQRWVQVSVSRREDTRFKRTQVFGLARRLFLLMGDWLVEHGYLKKRDDVFLLTVEQLEMVASVHHKTVRSWVKTAAKKYAFYSSLYLPRRIISKNLDVDLMKYKKKTPSTMLIQTKGIVASRGLSGNVIIKGQSVVIDQFDPVVDYRNKILVTRFTDPGWTIVFPSLKGLVVERGGMLSHAAIVAREFDLPCIINAKEAVESLRHAKHVAMDLRSGTVRPIE